MNVFFEGQLAPAPAIKTAAALAESRSSSGLREDDDDGDDDDDDHDACDDEFSSCGQLDPRAEKEREGGGEREEEGFHRGMEKLDPKKQK